MFALGIFMKKISTNSYLVRTTVYDVSRLFYTAWAATLNARLPKVARVRTWDKQ